ncbi:hypothetical protein Dda_8385 [Drechslerella dactyloides]|uniref:Uncharacterized protein n=1 Tax=Drechslerella dactyloides TaxID=74499 RepID=A0AAD6NH85_DREDA|nr:hypothetical protein Dda_8385 [Drechslerella dactyloides]
MLSFDELAGTLRTTKDRVLQGVARSPGGESPSPDTEGTGGTSSSTEASAGATTNTESRATEDPQGSNTSSTQSNVPRQSGTASQGSMLPSSRRDMGKGGREDENAS